ncbi:MAG: hypothetical protein IJW67_07360 [Blautia sp.]|nr:hypothetical protein [Blautia sp.]
MINYFQFLIQNPGRFSDRIKFDRLRAEGLTCLENKQMEELRRVISELNSIYVSSSSASDEDIYEKVNVVRS